jgi:hypothetical protein
VRPGLAGGIRGEGIVVDHGRGLSVISVIISKDMMRIALGRRADGESVTSIAIGLRYKTASGQQRTVSRRALYNAFKAYDAQRAEAAWPPMGTDLAVSISKIGSRPLSAVFRSHLHVGAATAASPRA